MSLSDAAPVCVECGTPVVTPQSGGEEEPLGAAPAIVEPKLYLEKTPRLGGSAIPIRDNARDNEPRGVSRQNPNEPHSAHSRAITLQKLGTWVYMLREAPSDHGGVS